MLMLHFYTSCFLEFSESIGMEHSEAVVRRCSVNKVFLKISENSQENTCTRVSFLNFIQLTLAHVFSFKFCEIFKNTFLHITPLVTVSETLASLVHYGGRYYIETSALICSANQWTGFYMTKDSIMKELKWANND